ncbi:MAG: hypothetical protein IJ087_07020 [Eggerthellaceae bacterium]|nr:hypothetical protein [Eggerthellaceae bacterium]
MKAYLDKFAAPGGAFGDVANLLIGGFNLLTEGEVNALPLNVRALNFPESGEYGEWWTCTTELGEDHAKKWLCVKRDGYVSLRVPATERVGVRPYIKLDLTGVSYNPTTQTFTEHKHDYVYSTNGDTITAVCRNQDGICKLPNCTASLQIVKPTLTTYGQTGEDISAEAAIVDEAGIRGNAAVEYYKVLDPDEGKLSYKLPAAPTDAGTYLAAIIIDPDNEASMAYVVYNIEKADNPATVQRTANAVTGGKTVDLAGKVSLGGATGTVSYAIDGDSLGCTISDEGVLTTGYSAGTVKVTVTVAADDNHKALEPATITVTITDKNKQTIEAADVAATYGDADKAVSAKVTSPTEGAGQISYAVKVGSEDYIAVDAATGALTIKKIPADGKAYVTVTVAETETSSQATKDVTVAISKANVVPPLVQANGWTADGTVRPLVTADGMEVAGSTTRFALGGNANNAPADSAYGENIPTTTDYGAYFVWYKVFGDENHDDSAPACVTVNVAAPVSAGVDGPMYTISTTDEWNEFAWKVNNGITFSGVVVQLANDISVSTMAGRSDRRFKGTFDGADHTLTFACTTSDECVSPFRYVEDARFVNLKVTGTIETSKQFAGGFVGDAKGNTTFTSCHSNVTINSSVSGDGTHGGFVARTDASGAQATFTDCLFDGSITGEATANCGGFVGWPGNNNVTCTNCLNAGKFTTSANGCATFSRSNNNSVTTNNSYYRTAYGTAQGTQTDETGEALRAKLGDGWMVSSVEGEYVVPKRAALAKLVGDGTIDAPYVIASVEEWNAFAQLVDDGNSFEGKVLSLNADISVTRMAGTSEHRFKGTFDGNSHTLTFNCGTSENYAAPFRYVEGAKFTNLTVAGNINTSARFAGGIVANSLGSTSLVSCRSKVAIASTASGDCTHGGLVALADAEGCHTAFVDCLFDGSVTGETSANCGGLLGWPGARTASFRNCLNAGTFGTKQESDTFAGCGTFSRVYDANNITIENCYYKTANGTAQGGTQTNETGGLDRERGRQGRRCAQGVGCGRVRHQGLRDREVRRHRMVRPGCSSHERLSDQGGSQGRRSYCFGYAPSCQGRPGSYDVRLQQELVHGLLREQDQ